VGSAYTLSFTSDRLLDHAQLAFHQGALVPVALSDQAYQFTTTLSETMHFEVQLADLDGLANKTPPRASIYVYADMLPKVSFIEPNRLKGDEKKVYDGTETITVPFEARDDFGVKEAELLVQGGGSSR